MPSVLVIDDYAAVQQIIAQFVRAHGYQVQAEGSGEAAIDILNGAPADAVIADFYLPGNITGIDVLVHHRKLVPKGCRILFTGVFSDTVRRICQSIDATYLPKPSSLDELIRTIETAVTRVR